MINLFKSNSPAGTFTVSIKDSDSNTLVSKGQTLAQMQSAGSADLSVAYYHGFVSFIFDYPPSLEAGTYTIVLSASGYTFTDTDHLGWLRDFDHKVLNNTGTTAANAIQEPLSHRIYSYRR